MRHDIRQLTELLTNYNFKPKNFIEIGSRDGHDTYHISQFWKLEPSNCFIIEAHPKCYENIINQYPYFNTFNVAATDETKVVSFNAGIFGQEENVGISSVLDRVYSPFISEKVEVDGWRMDEMMNELKTQSFDFAKIDVEGLGLEVLKGFGNKITTLKYIQIELETQEVWEGQSLYGDVVSYLQNNDFVILEEKILDNLQKDVIFKNIKL